MSGFNNVETKMIARKDALSRQYKKTTDDCSKYENTRTAFSKDRTRIIGSQSFIRLSAITQVYSLFILNFFNLNLILRSRLQHSIEIAGYAQRFAQEIGLEYLLCDIIALSHDLGHAIYGHGGTVAINKILEKFNMEVFDHELQTYRTVTTLEHFPRTCRGLNLTFICLQELLNRSKRSRQIENRFGTIELFPIGFLSLEGQVAEVFDKFFVIHDIEDYLQLTRMFSKNDQEKFRIYSAKSLAELDIPILSQICQSKNRNPKIIASKVYNYLLLSLYRQMKNIKFKENLSRIRNNNDFVLTNPRVISFEDPVEIEFNKLTKWMYQHVYTGNTIVEQSDYLGVMNINKIFRYLYTSHNETALKVV